MKTEIQEKKNSILYTIILLLIIGMPLQSMVFDALIPSKIDNLWRDFLLVFGLLVAIYQNRGRIQLGKNGVLILSSSMICLLYTLLSDRVLIAMNLFRTYVLPMFIYLIIINSIELNEESIRRLKKVFIVSASILAAWGIFQAWVLGDDFLIKIGYPSIGGYLRSYGFYIGGFYGYQRVASTFSAPNIAGVYFGISSLITATELKKSKRNLLLLVVQILALVLTFSRSAILGTLIAFLFYYRSRLFFFKLRIRPLYLIILISVPIAVWFADSFFLDGTIMNMISRSLSSTVNLTDPSAAKHLTDLWEPIDTILEHPFGLGLGYNGPIVLAQFGVANLVESSYYLLAYNFGILGMFVYVLPYIKAIFANLFYKRMAVSAAICLLLLVTYFLLPNVETYEIIFFAYLFIAFDEVSFNAHEEVGLQLA